MQGALCRVPRLGCVSHVWVGYGHFAGVCSDGRRGSLGRWQGATTAAAARLDRSLCDSPWRSVFSRHIHGHAMIYTYTVRVSMLSSSKHFSQSLTLGTPAGAHRRSRPQAANRDNLTRHSWDSTAKPGVGSTWQGGPRGGRGTPGCDSGNITGCRLGKLIGRADWERGGRVPQRGVKASTRAARGGVDVQWLVASGHVCMVSRYGKHYEMGWDRG